MTPGFFTTGVQFDAVENFKPAMEIISRLRKMPRVSDMVSPRKKTPTKTVPAAPTPTQTAYAVPTGSCFVAMLRRNMLPASAATKKRLGQSRVNPTVALRLLAQQISSTPAAMRINHEFMAKENGVPVLGVEPRAVHKAGLHASCERGFLALHPCYN